METANIAQSRPAVIAEITPTSTLRAATTPTMFQIPGKARLRIPCDLAMTPYRSVNESINATSPSVAAVSLSASTRSDDSIASDVAITAKTPPIAIMLFLASAANFDSPSRAANQKLKTDIAPIALRILSSGKYPNAAITAVIASIAPAAANNVTPAFAANSPASLEAAISRANTTPITPTAHKPLFRSFLLMLPSNLIDIGKSVRAAEKPSKPRPAFAAYLLILPPSALSITNITPVRAAIETNDLSQSVVSIAVGISWSSLNRISIAPDTASNAMPALSTYILAGPLSNFSMSTIAPIRPTN